MRPGRQMDAIIHEKVLKRFDSTTTESDGKTVYWSPDWETIPHYSTDIKDAWEVVEKLGLMICPTGRGRWFAYQHQIGEDYGEEDWWGGEKFNELYGDQIADTAPHAICLAALKAIV